MQIVVLGMHRSGTSVLARLLNMAGAYFGSEGSAIGQSDQNPKGFWERRDVRDVNDEILHAIGCDWDQLAGFDLGLLKEKARKPVEQRIRDIIMELEAHRPWMIKEPRLCLTLPLWRQALELPVAVVIRRHPIEIAGSLRTRNGFPLSLGLALWEVYTIHLLRELRRMPIIYVDHASLMCNPCEEFANVVRDLSALGVAGLRMPTEPEIAAFVDRTLYRSKDDGALSLSDAQQRLWSYFSGLKLHDKIDRDFEVSVNSQKDIAAHQGFLEARNLKISEAKAGELAKMRGELAELKESRARDQSAAIDALAKYQNARADRRRLSLLVEESGAQLKSSTAALEAALAREANLKRQLEQEAAVRQSSSVEQQQALAALRRKAESTDEKARKEVAELKKQLVQRDKKIEIMRSGFSWRATAPLRAIGFWVKGLVKSPPQPAQQPKKPSSGGGTAKKAVAKPRPPLADLPVDVVVCVHNALEDVRACLQSVAATRTSVCRMILVNDGSNEETTQYLEQFANDTSNVTLLSSAEARGYTRAVNHGLGASKAPYVILLNSDTIVPAGWIQKLLKCAVSDAKLGIVGPVSNAASWQSVPFVKSARGTWAVNPLPPGRTVQDMDDLTSQMSGCRYPRVPLLNGFCLLIKREVFDKVGIFDEEAFPKGYGEENDFCLRAAQNGFQLAVADDCYVFHAKSKSYTDTGRNELVAVTKRTLEERYGAKTFKTASATLQHNPDLARLRARIAAAVDRRPPWPETFTDTSLRVLFILPCLGKGGGVLSILQESYGMALRGVEARIAVYEKHLPQYLEHFSDYPAELFVAFRNQEDLEAVAARFQVAVGTIYTSIAMLQELMASRPDLLPAYYIQDYEPFFFEAGSEEHRNARASYAAIPQMVCFAKTQWICDTVQEREGVTVEKVQASVDHSVFYPLANRQSDSNALGVCAMLRPQTPRRAARETTEVLRILKKRFGEAIRITVFGCDSGNPAMAELGIDFELHNLGVLSRTEVAALLRNNDVFIDMSTYQAFGRTALEAMASGCAAVVPGNSGATGFAVDLENALMVDTAQVAATAAQVEALLQDPALLLKLKRNGIQTAMRYTVPGAVHTILDLLSRRLREKR